MKRTAIAVVFGVGLLSLVLGSWAAYWQVKYLSIAVRYSLTVDSVEKNPPLGGKDGTGETYAIHVHIEDSRGRKWNDIYRNEGPQDEYWPGRKANWYEVPRLDRATSSQKVVRAEFFRFWWPLLGSGGLALLAGYAGVRFRKCGSARTVIGAAIGLLAALVGLVILVFAQMEIIIFWAK